MSRVSDESYRTSDWRVIPSLLVGLVVLFGGLYVAAYLATDDRVPRNTTVAGVPIGGMTEADARARLADRLSALAERPVTLEANDGQVRLVPTAAGLHVDVAASLAQTGAGRSWKLARMWNYLAGGRDYPAVVTVDDATLTDAVQKVAAQLDQPPVEGGVTFRDGEAFGSDPSDGSAVDQPAAARALRAAFLGDTVVLDLPTRPSPPQVSRRDVSRAMSSFANPAMAAGVTYSFAGHDVRLSPDRFDSALSMVVQDGRLVPHLDGQRLLSLVGPALREYDRPPVDASMRIVAGHPQVVPGRDGRTFDAQDVTGSFLGLLTRRDEQRRHVVRAVAEPPRVTPEKVASWQIGEPVAEFAVPAPHSAAAAANLRHAVALVDGTVVRPGGTFSFNQTVGPRTPGNGFAAAASYVDGAQTDDDGGVGPLATALFNAAYLAGLDDLEHTPHASYLPGYPLGRDAGVAYQLADLRFGNATPYGVLVQAWTGGGRVHVRLWSTPYWDVTVDTSPQADVTAPGVQHLGGGAGCVRRPGTPGFDVEVTRTFRRHGQPEIDHTDRLRTHYLPVDTVLCS
jgi:vancomycin resistance protein YoaR